MADRLAAARRLKERCYAAWHTDPPELLRCAAALAALADAAVDAPAGAEVRALAQWTGAIADLVEGRLASALERLDAAHTNVFAALGRADDAAQTRCPKIMGLALLGRFDDALACADAARRALLALGDRRSAAKVALNTGSLCMQRDRYADAACHYRNAAVHFARIGDREHSVLATSVAQTPSPTSRRGRRGRGVVPARIGTRTDTRTAGDGVRRRAGTRRTCAGARKLPRSPCRARAGVARFRAARAAAAARVEAEKALGDAYLELRLLPEAEGVYESVLASLSRHEAAATQAWVWLQRARLCGAHNEPAPALATLARAERLFDEAGNAAGRAAAQLARSELLLAAGTVDAAQDAARAALGVFERLGLPAALAPLRCSPKPMQSPRRRRRLQPRRPPSTSCCPHPMRPCRCASAPGSAAAACCGARVIVPRRRQPSRVPSSWPRRAGSNCRATTSSAPTSISAPAPTTNCCASPSTITTLHPATPLRGQCWSPPSVAVRARCAIASGLPLPRTIARPNRQRHTRSERVWTGCTGG